MKTNFDPQDFHSLLNSTSTILDCLVRSKHYQNLCNSQHIKTPGLTLVGALQTLQQFEKACQMHSRNVDERKQDQIEAQNWARELLTTSDWAILDTESTGLSYQDQICQISVITPELTDGWQTYVSPTVPITPEASQVHGITDEDVKDAPTFDQVFLSLMRKIGRKDIVIFNAEIDLRLIKQSLKVHGIQLAFPTSDRRNCRIFSNGGSIHDAMLQYSQWVGEWNDHYGNYKWQPLPGREHTALGDCRATLEIIKQMAQEQRTDGET